MAEHIEVELKVETDADRRLKEWEAKRGKCPSFVDVERCYASAYGHCDYKFCPFVHWGWR